MSVVKTDSSIAKTRVEAVNHGPRAADKRLDLLILHYTGMPSADDALRWLSLEESQVSCHYFIFEDGRVVQMVDENRRAWHAGKSCWKGETDINSRSIGVEIANPGHEAGSPPFAEAQIAATIELCRDCVQRLGIRAENVLAHSDIAPQRKRDPGEVFPWEKLHKAGIGHWVQPAPISSGRFLQPGEVGEPVEALQSMLALYGYDVEISGEYCPQTRVCVTAFQRHFRPERVDGIADQSTIVTLHQLLSTLPLQA